MKLNPARDLALRPGTKALKIQFEQLDGSDRTYLIECAGALSYSEISCKTPVAQRLELGSTLTIRQAWRKLATVENRDGRPIINRYEPNHIFELLLRAVGVIILSLIASLIWSQVSQANPGRETSTMNAQ